jgi:hypothetical protein
MTVAALTSKIDYIENGVTLTFALPFRFLAGSISATRVLADGSVVALAIGVDFSTTGGSTDAGGSATLVSSVAGATLRFRRETARSQSTDYTTGDAFPAESHEAALDRSMLVDQEQDDKIADTALRAFKVRDGETAPTMGPLASFQGKVFGLNAGNVLVPIAVSGVADPSLRADLADDIAGLGAELVAYDGATVKDALDGKVDAATLAGSAGAAQVGCNDGGTGAQTRTLAQVLSEAPINLHDYYAVADGSNWVPALTKAVARMAATKRSIYVPPPPGGLTYYPMTAIFTLDMLPFFSTGFKIFGSGLQKSAFDFRGLPGNNFLLTCSGGSVPSPASCAYPDFADIGFIGDAAGPVFTVGQADFSDQINELRFHNVGVQNFNTTSAAIGAQFNAVFNPDILAVINCGSGGYVGGQGDAVQLRECAFGNFRGSYGSAQKAFHITTGFSYGNSFTNCDMENVSYCVVQDAANATRNTFIGGQWAYSSNAVHSTAGGRLLLVNPNPNPSGGGTLAAFVGSSVGVLIAGAPFTPSNLPTLAATTVAMTNATGMNLVMFMWGGAVTGINRNGAGTITWASNSIEFWPAGETRALTYSSAPTISFSVAG